MKKIIFIVLLSFFWTGFLFAQRDISKIAISGTVLDSLSGKSIEYPTIALFNDSLKPITSVAGGADGKFTIEAPGPGKYILSASMIGYTNSRNDIILDSTQRRINIGDIFITEGMQLSEITVVGVLPLIKNEPDKLTYNLESDPETPSSTLADILRKVPMLSVDGDDNVRLNGETNFKVLVNGRSSGLLVRNFKDAIKAMPASSIKSIEVITNPPAKYDAEGVGGIINIITNKKSVEGYNGSINAGVNTLGGYNGGGYFSVQIGKLAISTNVYSGKNIANKNRSSSETENFISDQFKYSSSDAAFDSYSIFTNAGIEASYEIDSLNLITLSGWGYKGSSTSSGLSNFISRDINGQVTRQYSNINEQKYGYGAISGSLSYQKTYKKPDQNLTFSYSLNSNPITTDAFSTIVPLVNMAGYSQNSINKADGREHTFQADYYDPLTKNHQLETGVKYILRQNRSNSEIWVLNEEASWVSDPTRINDLDYDQHIGSMYGGYAFKHKSLTAKAGFRMEYTLNDGVSKAYQENIYFTNEQFDIVPYFNLSYMLKKGQSLSAAFTQRLNRPGIWHLNPYVNDTDPMNISYGNPDLETVRRNSVNLGYRKSSMSWNLGLNLMGNFTKNNIEQIRRIYENGVTHSTYENIGKNNSYRLNVNFSYRSGQKYSVNLNGAVSYTTVSSLDNSLQNDGFSFNGGINGNVALWKKANMNFNGYMYGGNVMLQTKYPIMYMTSLGLSQRFLNDKLTFSIFVREPLSKTKTFKFESRDLTYVTNSITEQTMRSINFSLFWRFGNFNPIVRKARRSSTDDRLDGGSPAATNTNP